MAGGNTTEAGVALQKPPSFNDGTMSNKMVEVIVGPESKKKSFVTYFDLLVYWVPRWGHLLKGNEETLRLYHDDPRVIKIFFDWMLSDGHKLPQWAVHKPTNGVLESLKEEVDEDEDLDEDEDIDEDEDFEEGFKAYYRRQPEAEALDCYIFAENWGVRLFQNDLFDSILEMQPRSNLLPSYSIVAMAWKNLLSSSPMLKYQTDVFARNWTYKTDIGHDEELIIRKNVPAAFWIAILSQKDEYPKLSDDYPPWEEDLCQYHVHIGTEKEHCYWQKINNGRGYCSDDSEDSDADMDEYEADFIDDGELEVGSEDKSSTKRKLAEMMEEDSDASILSGTL